MDCGALVATKAGAAVTEQSPAITPYPDGPLIVRGPIELREPNGELIPQKRNTIALCRCGLSAIKPFCDGTHKLSGFRTED